MAGEIVKKLSTEVTNKKSGHDLVKVFDGNRIVARFGMRRSSKKDKGHDHIPRELGCTTRFCKDLAQCTRTAEDYIALIRDDEEDEP